MSTEVYSYFHTVINDNKIARFKQIVFKYTVDDAIQNLLEQIKVYASNCLGKQFCSLS